MIVLKPKPKDAVPCKCSKSKCIKMYCECFTAGYFCDSRCKCCTCLNDKEHESHVREAWFDIKKRKDNQIKNKK